jgi:hypothetical protein
VSMATENDERIKQLLAALAKIRFAGNDSHPTAIWMQKVAAHAMEPEKWTDPGEAETGSPLSNATPNRES